MRAIQKGKNVILFTVIFVILGWLTANPIFYAIGAVLAFILIFDRVVFFIALDGMEVSIAKKISTNKMFINNILEVENDLELKVKYRSRMRSLMHSRSFQRILLHQLIQHDPFTRSPMIFRRSKRDIIH
jgi:hypothetical protein